MPFKSEKQRRYLHANHPEIAKRWEQEYAGGGLARLRQAYPTNLTVGEEMVEMGTPLGNELAFRPNTLLDNRIKNMWEMQKMDYDQPKLQPLKERDWKQHLDEGTPLSLPRDEYKGIEGWTAESPLIMRDFDFDVNQGGIDTIDINEMADVYSPYENYGQFFRNQPTDERNMLTGIKEGIRGIDIPWDKAGDALGTAFAVANDSMPWNLLRRGADLFSSAFARGEPRDPNLGRGLSGNVSWAGSRYDKEHGVGSYRDKNIRDCQRKYGHIEKKTAEGKKKREWFRKEAERITREKIAAEKAAAAAANARTQRRAGRGGDHMSRSRDQGGLGISRSQAQAVSDANRDAGMSGWGL